jgi:hypothetical protein
MNREPFWLTDPAHMFTKENWVQFVPQEWMTVPEALNAIVRFTVYFSVVLTLMTGKSEYILAIPVVALITVFLNQIYPETQTFKEAFSMKSGGSKETKPTPSNPFMNVTLDQISGDPERPAAGNVLRSDIAESAANAFAKTSDLFMDTSDRFDMMQSSRAFYTTASTTTPNDLGGFQDFLNKDNVSRKADTESYVAAKGSVYETK